MFSVLKFARKAKDTGQTRVLPVEDDGHQAGRTAPPSPPRRQLTRKVTMSAAETAAASKRDVEIYKKAKSLEVDTLISSMRTNTAAMRSALGQ